MNNILILIISVCANADSYYSLWKKNMKKNIYLFLYRTRHFQTTWFGKPHNKHNWEVTRVLLLKKGACLVYELCSAPPFVFGEHPKNPLFPENPELQSTTLLLEPIHSFSRSFPHSLFLSVCLSLFFSSAHGFCQQLAVASSRVPDHSTQSVKLCNLPISPST